MTYNREKNPAPHAFNFASAVLSISRSFSEIRKEFAKIDIYHKTKARHVNLLSGGSLDPTWNWLDSGRAIALPIFRD